jgi:glucosamine kinase
MAKQDLFLGIDGGGTACSARVTDPDGRVLGEGRAGSANTRLGIDRAFTEITTATVRALAEAGFDESHLGRLHAGAGLAGLSLASDKAEVEAHPHAFASLWVESDAYVACLGAHQGEDGGILVLGTGSCGCAIVGGKTITVGGWGFHLSDHGSGAQVGLRALRRALLARENVIPASPLAERVLSRFQGSIENAVLWAATAKPADYGTLTPLVVELAGQGDAMARDIMDWAGEGASKLIRVMAGRGAGRIALVGGFSAHLRPWLAEDVQALLVVPQGDAKDGAILMARRAQVAGETGS